MSKILIEFNRPCINRNKFLIFNIDVDTFGSKGESIITKLSEICHVDYCDITIFDSDDNQKWDGRIYKDYFEDIYFNIHKVTEL